MSSVALSRALQMIERLLLFAGAGLAVYVLLVTAQTQFFASLPVPGPRTTISRRPGEDPSEPRPTTNVPSRPTRLNPGDWVARLSAPTVELTATVLEGSDDATLARAAGHIQETAYPGESGNVGIAAHRDTIFRPVRNLKVGDPLEIMTGERVFDYRITSTTIVNPEDVYVLDPTEQPTLTLVTCYPFNFIGHAPQRFIVKADLVAARPR
jgi:sortase A